MLSKYTILHNKTKLEQKRGKMQKSEMYADPPLGGWGVGLKEPAQNDSFLLLLVTISEK